MDFLKDIEVLDCPLCDGTGILEEESGWCMYVACCDCGCRTAEVAFKTDAEREQAAKQAANMWNMGKVISIGAGD